VRQISLRVYGNQINANPPRKPQSTPRMVTHTNLVLDDLPTQIVLEKRKEASQVFSPPCYSPFGESD